MLIAVVGTDGAGKSTVTSLVTEALEREGNTVAHIDRWGIVDNPLYPATRFMRPDARDMRVCMAEMPNPARFLFLVWQIGIALLGRKTESGAHHHVEMTDGYWMKHAASEVAYGLDRPWVENVVAALPVPDLVIYLRIAPAAAWGRKVGNLVPYECGMDPACSYDSFLRHQHAIKNLLDDWSAGRGWAVVNAERDLTAVVDDVLRLVRSGGVRASSASQGNPRVELR